MKKLLLICCLLFSLSAWSQDEAKIRQTINQTASAMKTMQCDFVQTKHLKMLNEGGTKVYVTENGQDYAVVASNDENSTFVSFKASQDGVYTLSVDIQNLDMDYLHLIDNETGADIDLLQNPNYTFEAKTTDSVNRFKVVYATMEN